MYGAKNAFLARNKYQIHQSKTCRNHGLSSCTPGRKRDEHLSCDHLSRIAFRNQMKWLLGLVTLLYETSLQHNDHRICSGEPTQQHSSSSSAPLSRWWRVRESPAIASQPSYIFLHILWLPFWIQRKLSRVWNHPCWMLLRWLLGWLLFPLIENWFILPIDCADSSFTELASL